jgi:hypothetical protein
VCSGDTFPAFLKVKYEVDMNGKVHASAILFSEMEAERKR